MKLNFEKTIMNHMECFVSDKYKVIMYDSREVGAGFVEEKPTWYAYVGWPYKRGMQFLKELRFT